MKYDDFKKKYSNELNEGLFNAIKKIGGNISKELKSFIDDDDKNDKDKNSTGLTIDEIEKLNFEEIETVLFKKNKR